MRRAVDPRAVPNLFGQQTKLEILRFYESYLARLKMSRRDRRLVEACKRIRAHAARYGHPQWAYFTYSPEIRALSRQRDFSNAWRRLRQWEREATGKTLRVRAVAWTDEELGWFFHHHPNILYFLHKYEPARRMLQALLAKQITCKRKGMSFEILPYVYNLVVRPRDLHEVTLFHIYRRLGKSLAEWSDWKRFVAGLHPKLFRLAGIQREDLLRDPSLLRRLCTAIKREQEARLTAGVSRGERELADSPSKVQRYQHGVARKKAQLDVRIAQSGFRERLHNLFPELNLS